MRLFWPLEEKQINGCHATQHNDTQHNDIHHNDIQHKMLTYDPQHKQLSALMMFTITTLYHQHKILINDNQYNDT